MTLACTPANRYNNVTLRQYLGAEMPFVFIKFKQRNISHSEVVSILNLEYFLLN